VKSNNLLTAAPELHHMAPNHGYLNSIISLSKQGPIYWKIPHPLPMSSGGKNMKRRREKGRKGKEKGRKGKENEKKGSKRVK
jgi:hypothetical protein